MKVPTMHFGEKGIIAALDTDVGKTGITFALPDLPYIPDDRRGFRKIVASINFGTGLFTNERETTFTPFIPELNNFYGGNCCFRSNAARAEPGTIGIIIDEQESDLTFFALNVSKLINKVFSLAGLTAKSSEPGLITRRIIDQLGGLQGNRVFKIRGVRDLIKQYKPDKSFTRSNAIQIIGQVNQTKGIIDFEDYENLPIGTQAGKKLTPQDAFNHLIKFGVFRAGLELECPNCFLDFWLSLDEIRRKTNCEYCGFLFDITPQLKDRDWRYRRSGLFGKDDDQSGALPVIITLQQMDTAFALRGLPFLYSTQTELFFGPHPNPNCEMDFIILSQTDDHQVEMVIGECKNRQKIDEKDVLNLRTVAEALEAKGIRVYIVFSKLSDFTPDELQLCNVVNDLDAERLILFTARELEPYGLYEKTSKSFPIQEDSFSLSEMSENTRKIFYNH